VDVDYFSKNNQSFLQYQKNGKYCDDEKTILSRWEEKNYTVLIPQINFKNCFILIIISWIIFHYKSDNWEQTLWVLCLFHFQISPISNSCTSFFFFYFTLFFFKIFRDFSFNQFQTFPDVILNCNLTHMFSQIVIS